MGEENNVKNVEKIQKRGTVTTDIFPSGHDIFKCSAIPVGGTDRLKGRHAADRKDGRKDSRQPIRVRSSTCKKGELAAAD